MGTKPDTGSEKPVIDVAEPNAQQVKFYISQSMKAAFQRAAKREGMAESEMGRSILMAFFGSPAGFGGVEIINSLSRY